MDQLTWDYMVGLRRDILSAVSGIENARGYLWWDNTIPNSSTRSLLKKILSGAIRDAAQFGLYVVTRHNCSHRSHAKLSDKNGYIWTDPYGLNVEWQDPRFEWSGEQLFQGRRNDPCPCSPNNVSIDHYIIDDFIYEKGAANDICLTIQNALTCIHSAIEESGDKKPRSGIREHLLRSILILNDAIMPMAVEEHIKAVLETRRA
ncbi:hypothetical protein [uncultured Novosphingobium sp.]|uniref:hypothetical protein n=1 Tax=uncultured Novosphingobium sp. TaxID=292277 RepID=UPI00259A36D5|nr:hypothetical protein [uncultured Novosphingobium sp.]